MRTSEKQSLFLRDVARLVLYVRTLEGIYLTGGDLYQDNSWHDMNSQGRTQHLKSGQHPRRMAIDLNLFVDGTYITGDHDVWDELGDFWEYLSPENRWGGNFAKKDYNHFERLD